MFLGDKYGMSTIILVSHHYLQTYKFHTIPIMHDDVLNISSACIISEWTLLGRCIEFDLVKFKMDVAAPLHY